MRETCCWSFFVKFGLARGRWSFLGQVGSWPTGHKKALEGLFSQLPKCADLEWQSWRNAELRPWSESGVRRQKVCAHCEVLRIQLREESDHQGADTFTHSEVTASSLVTL